MTTLQPCQAGHVAAEGAVQLQAATGNAGLAGTNQPYGETSTHRMPQTLPAHNAGQGAAHTTYIWTKACMVHPTMAPNLHSKKRLIAEGTD